MRKNLRLKKPSDFKKTFKEGKRRLAPHFVVYRRENTLSCLRVGVSISKRHFKHATKRNRLRRVATELFRTEISPHLRSGYDFVVTSRASRDQATFNKKVDELKNLILSLRK